MDANIVSFVVTGLGIATGTWAIVKWSEERAVRRRVQPSKPPVIAAASAPDVPPEPPPPPPPPPPSPPVNGGNGNAAPRFAAPPVQQLPDIRLSMFNTWTLGANQVYTLTPPEPGIYGINLENLGPGALYIRADADPAPGDPQSATIVPGSADHAIHIPTALKIVVDADSTVTARMMHHQ